MRGAALIVLVLGSSSLGCGELSHQPVPGPRPIPPSWQPAAAIRERLAARAAGEVVLDDEDGLAPDEAALMAIDQNPRLRAARTGRGLAQAELMAAGVLPNPRLEGALSFPTSGGEADVLGYGAGVTWNVSPLFSRRARVSAAEQSLVSVDLDIAWQEWQVGQSARLHAIRAINLTRRVQVARELEATGRQRVDALRQARLADAVTELELTDAERSHAKARVKTLELLEQLTVERTDLEQALGVDPLRDIALDLSFTPAEEALDREGLLETLPSRRLDLLALQHAHRSHDDALRAAVLERFPPVEIGLEVDREVDGVGSAGVALSIEIPFFDRNQAAVARERVRRDQVEAEYEARLMEARGDTVRTLEELDLVRQQLAAARRAWDAAAQLAEQARAAVLRGALSPQAAADVLERSYESHLRKLELEQTLAELSVVLSLASGTHVR